MNEIEKIARLVDDLAGYWTEPMMHLLKAAGMQHVSVDLEIATWHVLRAALMKELGRKLGQGALVSEISRA